MEDKLLTLHTNLIQEGYDLPDYETFRNDMSDETKSKKLHENLVSEGYELPDYDTFLNDVGLKKKEVSFLDYLESGQKSATDSIEQPRSLDESLIPQQPSPTKKRDTGSYAGDILERIGAGLIDLATSTPKKLKFAQRLMNIPKDIAKKELSMLGLSDEAAEKIASNIPFIKPEGIDAGVKLSSTVWDKISNTEGFKDVQGKAEELRESSARYDKLFSEYFKNKEYGKALGTAILSGAESLPITIEAAFGGPVGLMDVGFYAASMQYDQLAANADMTEVQKISNALANGAFEILTEKLGSANYGALLKKLYKTVGKEQAETAVKSALKNWLAKMWKRFGIYTAPAGESLEEGINQFAGNLTARVTGEDVDRPLDYGVLDAMGQGFGGGTFFVGPGALAQARAQYYEARLKEKEKIAKEQAKAKEPSKTTDKGTATTEVGALEVPEAVRKQFEEDNLSLSKEELKEMKAVEKTPPEVIEESTQPVTEEPQAEPTSEPTSPKAESELSLESVTERAIKYGIIDRDRGTDVLDLIGNYDEWAKGDANFKAVVDNIPKQEWEQLKLDARSLRRNEPRVVAEPTMEEAIAEEPTPAKVEEVPTEVKEEVKIEEPPKVKEPNIFNKQQVIESLLSEYPEEVREQVRNSFARAENFEEMAAQAGFNSLGGGQYTRESVAKVQEDVVQKTEDFTEFKQTQKEGEVSEVFGKAQDIDKPTPSKDVLGNKILSAKEWKNLTPKEREDQSTITRPVTDRKGNTFNVDYGIAPFLQRILNLGLSTGQSDSGMKSDHPRHRFIEGKKEGEIVGGGTYLTFWKPEATSIKETGRDINSQEDIDNIRKAAKEAGFIVYDGNVFFQPSLGINLPFTKDGTWRQDILKETNILTNERHPELGGVEENHPSGDKFIEWLDKRNSYVDEVVNKHGGEIVFTDKQIADMFEKFVSLLEQYKGGAKETLQNYLNTWSENTLKIKDNFIKEIKEDFDMVLQKLKNMGIIKTDCL